MGKDGTAIPREFVLKQIENEIHAGFSFVGAVSRYLKISDTVKEENQMSTAASPADSAIDHVRVVARRLNELREAVDLMLKMHLEAQ